MAQTLDLLAFQVEVLRCATRVVPVDEMVKLFTSRLSEEGRIECLIQHLGFITNIENEHQAYEFAVALIEAGVAYDSQLLISRAAETYLARADADLRVVTHFEMKSPHLRTFEGQLSMRQVILESHGIKVDSLSPECDKIINFLAQTRSLNKVSPHELNRMPRSPSAKKLAQSLSKSDTTPRKGIRKQRDADRDGTQSD